MAISEVKLWSDKREREMFDNYADLFAIIKTTEKLEKAYVRDVIPPAEFMNTYKMDCPAALNRLLVSGVPATVEHKGASSSESGSAVAVAECVQHYITAMDSLKLNMVAVDQVHPLLLDLLSSLNRVPLLPADFEGKVKTRDWIAKLNKMGASDELNDQQSRQLLFDLDSSYNAFINALPSASK
ncbi:hypothetical protein GOP47_0003730 [Adiantum capillus-veneris]|uniref:Vacuolar protein sorting-associated protein 28 homolog n=1 Tax=Adiantum capillus-veneris TaxID=13818 RepID=A0A9D4V7V3_ADICA|nr:hypothetical protein GOP47_0003730 [Adiantum capillus-veneris]